MSDDLITFVIDGPSERNGHIPADVFLAKMRQFIATLYAFDRAFAKRDKRGIELDVVDLSRNSPARVAFHPRATTAGYDPQAVVSWTVDQFSRIYNDNNVDPDLTSRVIEGIVDLSHRREDRAKDLTVVQVEYKGSVVVFDARMEERAKRLRDRLLEREIKTPWRAGVSRGSLFGELRGVMDFDGERRFYIRPPSGADQVQCIFPEAMRSSMTEHLFKAVRVHGFLRYDGQSPFPFMMEAERLEGVPEEPEVHFSDLAGIFKGREPADAADWGDEWPTH